MIFKPGEILTELVKGNVEFIVIGGVAGAPPDVVAADAVPGYCPPTDS